MPNPYPISVTPDDGVTQLTGEATFTDPENQPQDGATFLGWTATDEIDPASVSSNGGSLDLAGGILTAALATPQASGALPTHQFVSGVGSGVDPDIDSPIYVPITYDNSSADATLKIEMSPDAGATYSTLGTQTWKTFTGAVAGNIHVLELTVPNGWLVKLTATHCTIGLGTYLHSND